MPLSPSRAAGARATPTSNAPPGSSSRKGNVPHPVNAPPDKQLGFTPPEQPPLTALQQLGAPSADFKGADDAPQQQAAPSSPGPLKAAVARLLKGCNMNHYIVFRNGELALDANKPKGLGLGKPEQHKALCNLIVAELSHMRPREEASSAELNAFQASAHALAKAFVNRALQQLGKDIKLAQLLRMLDQLRAVYGVSASELDANATILRDSANSDVPARAAHAPGATAPARDTRIETLGLLTTTLFSGLLLQFGLYWLPGGYPVGVPFIATDMNEVMDRIMDDSGPFIDRLQSSHALLPRFARMLDAIHEDPSLSDHTIRHANRIRETLTTGVSHTDRLAGAGPCAAALLLSLAPERLKRMFLTTAQVNRLAEEAFVVLGHLPCFEVSHAADSSRPAKALFDGIISPRPEEGPGMVSQRANAFMDSPGGAKIAHRFTSAIQILLHNAQRLEAFADLDDAFDEQLEYESASIFDLLQEYVPADFDHAPPIDLHAQPKMETPALPLMEDPLAAHEPSMDAPPVVVHAASPEPEVETKVAPNPPRAARQVADARPVRVAADTKPAGTPRFPGAKRRNPAEHFHPRNHRALSRDQLKQREEVLKARELNLIGAWDKWTPELRSLLKERGRATRMAAQETTDISAGQNLVRPPKLHR